METSLVKSLKPVLIIGCFLGVLPIQGLLIQKKTKAGPKLTFRCWSPQFCFSVLLILFTIANMLTEQYASMRNPLLTSEMNAISKINSQIGAIYLGVVVFIYVYLLRNTKPIIDLIWKWAPILDQDRTIKTPNTNLSAFSKMISGIVLSYAVIEHTLMEYALMERALSENGGQFQGSLLKTYFNQHENWSQLISYSPFFTVWFMFWSLWTCLGWNFADILCIILCRAVTLRIKAVQANAREQLRRGETSVWNNLRNETLMQKSMIEDIQKIIVPLILASYFMNILMVSLNLYKWLSPSWTVGGSGAYYVTVSFGQFLLRTFLVTHYVAQVNTHATKIQGIVQECPDYQYCLSLERLERMLILDPIGINVIGLFRITRQTFSSIIGFVFSMEIILLQTNSTNAAGSL